MKHFWRSLRYVLRYRAGIAANLLCTLAIGVLWAGGLAAMLPGAKILLSPEGLHGWAYNTVAGNRLGATLTQRAVPASMESLGLRTAWALDVRALKPDGAGAAAGLHADHWVVGVQEGSPPARQVDAADMAQSLASLPAATLVSLRTYDPVTRAFGRIDLALPPASAPSRAMAWIARQFRQPQTYAQRYPMLVWLLVFAVVLTIVRGLLRVLQDYLAAAVVLRGLNDLRRDCYETALSLPITFFSRKGSSDTLSRFIQDTGILAKGQVTLLGKALVEPVKAFCALAVAMALSWQLTLLALLAGPPAVLLIRRLGRAMRRTTRQSLHSYSAMLETLQETLLGIRVVKAYTMEGTERRRFLRVTGDLLRQQLKLFWIEAASSPLVEVLGVLAAMGAVAVAGYWVLHGHQDVDPERFLVLMACLAAMFDPVRKLAPVSTVFHGADVAAERIFELRDAPREGPPGPMPTLPRHCRSIEFRHVSYRYDGAPQYALRDVNLAIQAGEALAIVGPNGSGKTTLISLLPRLLVPQEGAVLIDGHDTSQYSLRSLRRQIGLVTQEAVLFHATIEENIAYGLRRADPEKVRQAARLAYVDEFVDQLPQGYQTPVGPHGATLSGGQRQRISIARAILRDPAILIFDEAMSQIDSHSEQYIHLAMEQFSRGRTTLIVAHRFATVLAADRIVVLNAGQVVDVGPHQDLVSRCELYGHLYRTQLLESGGTPAVTTEGAPRESGGAA